MSAAGSDARGEVLRYLVGAIFAVSAHAAIALAVLHWRDPDEDIEPSTAIVLESAPTPAAPLQERHDLPPGPEQVQASAPAERPNQRPEAKPEERVLAKLEELPEPKIEQSAEPVPPDVPPIELPPAPNPEIALSIPPREMRPDVPRAEQTTHPREITDEPPPPRITIAPREVKDEEPEPLATRPPREANAEPPKPEQIERPPPDVKIEDPEVADTTAPTEARPNVAEVESDSLPAPATTAPEAPQVIIADTAAAPSEGAPNLSDSQAIPAWRAQLGAVLERNKRYPVQARDRGHQGVVQLSFSLDRQGRVVASGIVRGSGFALLDQEVLDLLRRAQPFPPPPPELRGDRITLTVPIRFSIR